MPVVDVDPDDLRRMTGHDEKSDDELKDDLFGLGIEYEEETEDGEFQLEFEADRLDRLSIAGIARSLRYQYGDARGVYVPKTNDPDWTIEVDESVPDERPYVTGAVIRGLDMNDEDLEAIIQLQEKLHATMGRKRAKGAIGIHDLTMLKGGSALRADERESGEAVSDGTALRADERESGVDGENTIRYVGVEPDEDTFVPLDSDRELTPAAVLEEHPVGEKYADLVSEYDRYPAIYDDIGLFSFPPVINGRRTEVSTESRDLFVEMTGTDQWTIDKMLNVVCYALDARGGRVEEVEVAYPDGTVVRPDLAVDEKELSHRRIERTLGIDLDEDDAIDLFERSGLDADPVVVGDDELAYEVAIPPYRVDVLHPVDLVDDVGRTYGFNNLTPRYPDVSTVGARTEASRHEEAVRNVLVGLGFEDMLNFNLTSEAENFERMGLDPDAGVMGAGEPATIVEAYSEDFTIVRTWALPSLLMVLENNTHREYPQDLAEIGFAAHVDEDELTNVAERRTVAGVLARTDASFEDAKGRLQSLARNFGVDLETPPTDHPSFIDGRTASVVFAGDTVGVVGEIHPGVLVEHDLEVPVAGFEFELDGLR
ncbi:Phenylalanyl-tRNA synthetase beta subunit [Halanaeroarchaeum sp. HSR-CO]|uniref:phenylalanine--tRNA ligase subunit beta n=1 Tax=Halanaeroarchaeum sp. HSR-CO TaxID=2866382 RepID=UPI00217D1745|nr:phenylalanine--tRNA ligase subunit beta [Halanaeroarchaeum sp. HSR-CO]UWG48937.1 Phenylalanyl-tRNA synthetase beta subunit [Halanaeroarchaeum sp. HSR-CO]